MVALTNEQVEQYYSTYIDTFNKGDFAQVAEQCLSKDLFFYRDEVPPLDREGMTAFYKEAWTHWKETLVVRNIEHISVDISSELHFFTAQIEIHLYVFDDWIDGPYGTFYASQEEQVFEEGILYGMDREGKMVVIL
jgi:hypothetical protein